MAKFVEKVEKRKAKHPEKRRKKGDDVFPTVKSCDDVVAVIVERPKLRKR